MREEEGSSMRREERGGEDGNVLMDGCMSHTLPSPLGWEGCGAHIYPINTVPSSPPLSSLLISYPLFSHDIPQTTPLFHTHHHPHPYTTHKKSFF